ncbi:MAG TPA: Xaa-Pro peptidase family protein [Opitutaceae bacterium]|nr:Xaa-Pro peptidase family protein [Opitutaceae bacterium]
MAKSSTPSPLLYADSLTDANQLYYTGMSVPDPFLAFGIGRKKYGVFNALEFSRAKKESSLDVVLSLEECRERAQKRFPHAKIATPEIVATLAREFGLKRFVVPDNFPAKLAFDLFDLGLAIGFADGSFFPERDCKKPAELAAIREGNRCSALGFTAVERILKASTIKGGFIQFEGKKLTSERLKFAIETACLAAGAVSLETIVAAGDQACDPHCRGSGPLRAGDLLIVDIFPRVTATGYHGDMTRTYLKGRASDAQRKLVATVHAGQKLGLRTIRAGLNGRKVHEAIVALFEKEGFQTTRDEHGSRGFFHGTGHGLGLDVHEYPRVSAVDNILKKGHVVTVEPGLYYPGLGGCRIEDVVHVTTTGNELLSKHPYRWEFA